MAIDLTDDDHSDVDDATCGPTGRVLVDDGRRKAEVTVPIRGAGQR